MTRWIAKVKRSFTGWSARLGKVARWMAGLSIGTLGALAAAFPSAGDVVGWLSPLVILATLTLIASPGVWVASLLAKVGGRRREAEVGVVDGELELTYAGGESQRYRSGTVLSGMVVPLSQVEEGDPAAGLRLLLKNGDQLRLELDSLVGAEELLDRLALGPGQRRLVFRWGRLVYRVVAAVGGYFAAAIPLIASATALEDTVLRLPFAFLSMVLPFVVGGWASRQVLREVVAGTDGVQARIGRKKVAFRFADVGSVELRVSDVVFSVKGEEVIIPLDMDDTRQARALGHRLRAAWAHFQTAAGSGGAERFLRGGLSFDEWKAKLGRLLAGAATMREAPLRVGDALSVLEDPEADPEARAGAALALAIAGSEDDQRRVRVAIESTTRPKVRVALDAALEGDLEEKQLEAARAEHTAD